MFCFYLKSYGNLLPPLSLVCCSTGLETAHEFSKGLSGGFCFRLGSSPSLLGSDSSRAAFSISRAPYIERQIWSVQFCLYALGSVLVMRVHRGIKIVSPPGIWSPGYFSTKACARTRRDEKCPMKVYKKSTSHRRSRMNKQDVPFFFAMKH